MNEDTPVATRPIDVGNGGKQTPTRNHEKKIEELIKTAGKDKGNVNTGENKLMPN